MKRLEKEKAKTIEYIVPKLIIDLGLTNKYINDDYINFIKISLS